MPRKPPKDCAEIGCSTVTLGRHCERHAKAYGRARGSATARGYGYDWQKLRAWHLRQHPLCADCEARGTTAPADDVDHVVPIAVDPSRRLDPTNLRSLCRACHAAKTALDQRRVGAGHIAV